MSVCLCLACYKFQFIILFISRCLSWWYCLSCLVRCFFVFFAFFLSSYCTHLPFVQRYLINRPRSQTQQAMRMPAESAGFVVSMETKNNLYQLKRDHDFWYSSSRSKEYSIYNEPKSQYSRVLRIFSVRFPCLWEREKVEKIWSSHVIAILSFRRGYTLQIHFKYAIHIFMWWSLLDSYMYMFRLNEFRLKQNAGSLAIHCTNCTNKTSKINSNLKG